MSALPLAARLNIRAQLERPVESDDGEGGHHLAYEPAGALWLAAQPQADTQLVRAGRAEQQTQWRLEARWHGDMAAGWRILFEGHVLVLTQVLDPDGKRQRLEMLAREEAL